MPFLSARGPLLRPKSVTTDLSAPAGYSLVFEDNFDYGSPGTRALPDPQRWGIPETRAGTDATTNYVWVDGTKLTLRTTGTNNATRISTAIRNSDSRFFNAWPRGAVGVINMIEAPAWLDVRMKPSPIRGVMSEIVSFSDWVLADSSDFSSKSEIDVCEARGVNPTRLSVATHRWSPTSDNGQGSELGSAPVYEPATYHQFIAHWDTTFVRQYVDGVLRIERNMASDPAPPIFGFPVGFYIGCWTASANPDGTPDGSDNWAGVGGVAWPVDTSLEVDYVRIYRPALPTGNLFTEHWTGANGAVWNATRWPTKGVTGSSVVEIRMNQGRLSPGGAAYAACWAHSTTSVSNFEMTISFTMAEGGEQYHAVSFRGSGSWTADGYEALDGYRLEINRSTEQLILVVLVGGARTTLAAVAKSFNRFEQRFMRIRCVGTSLRVRMWSGPEPSTWDVDVTHSGRASGVFGFGSFNGNATAAKPIQWDSMVVNSA